jgi:hypothetical protein
MLSFKSYLKEVKEPTGELKDSCWKGYTAVGTKKKGGREVPNCVPKKEEVELDEGLKNIIRKINRPSAKELSASHYMRGRNYQKLAFDPEVKGDAYFDSLRQARNHLKASKNINKLLTKEEVEELDEAKSAAWQRSAGKDPEGGLNRKGVASYRRENPGSKLKMAVTTEPSKLDPDSKSAKRRKSFCSRMGGMKKRLTSAKTAKDPDSRINKALRKWNC